MAGKQEVIRVTSALPVDLGIHGRGVPNRLRRGHFSADARSATAGWDLTGNPRRLSSLQQAVAAQQVERPRKSFQSFHQVQVGKKAAMAIHIGLPVGRD
jgi:hypothetical protein